jgi:hypothetical protein
MFDTLAKRAGRALDQQTVKSCHRFCQSAKHALQNQWAQYGANT